MWRCPAHADRTPSLHVEQGARGVVLRCYAGCETSAIVAELGLTLGDLFDAPRRPRRANGSAGRIVATYDYRDERGELVYQVVREQPKDFAQRRPDGAGGWIWNLGDTRRVLYRLPALRAALVAGDPVWIAEGERDVERLEAEGCVATCNAGGAGKWRDDYAEVLRGAADVRVIADRDVPGYRHARDVARSLRAVGASVRVLEALAGKDVTDHLDAGHALEDLVEVDPEAKLRELEASAGTGAPVAPTETSKASASPTSDVANAARFGEAFGADARWVPALGWLVWSGSRWERSETAALELATRVGRLVAAEAAEIEADAAQAEGPRREQLDKSARERRAWARTSESEPRIRALLNLARPALELDVEQLDAAPFLLNCANGTIDLRTGELRPHERDNFITKTTGVMFDPAATSDVWQLVLEHAMPDAAVRDFVQRAAGYTACGCVGEDVVLLIHGPTRTSKGTIAGALAAALGEYATAAGLEDLAERDRMRPGGARPELARLRGARMVSIYETGRALRLDDALVKTLSGSDPISVRELYSAPIEFLPKFVVWLATNHRPRVAHDDDALWERIREVPFNVQLAEHERDPEVRRRLTDPADLGPAVLAWVVEGALRWQRDGLAAPDGVRRATAAYRNAMDPFADFFGCCCVLTPGAQVLTADLRTAYEAWARETGEKPLGGKRFARELESRGCRPGRIAKGIRVWTGIGLQAGAVEHVDDRGADSADDLGDA
jgi:putative DNA primase/helicase